MLNRAFAFAKIRATESIYETKGGFMHSPGGGAYYAAIWANDQAEYANPFFPFLGDAIANESAINSYRHFARYMNPDYKQIPSSHHRGGDQFLEWRRRPGRHGDDRLWRVAVRARLWRPEDRGRVMAAD